MSSPRDDHRDAVRQALADLLGSTDIDVTGDAAGRLPSGEEVRLVHGTVRDVPNAAASVVVDASGAVQPLRRFEALYGRDFFAAELVDERPEPVPPPEPVTINPPTNTWTLPECVTEQETVTVHVPKSHVPPKADVYLLADTTLSMTPAINAVRNGISAILGSIGSMGFDIGWGVGNYKDFPAPGLSAYAFQHQLAPTTDLAAVATAVSTWSVSGGSDIPEGQLYALEQIAGSATGWRPDSKRILVWFGDAPGHDPVCKAISGAAADVTEVTATAALVGAEVTVVAVSTDTGTTGALDGDPTAFVTDYGVCTVGGSPRQATRITDATHGSHTTGVNATEIVDTLASLIATAVRGINHLVLKPTGAIAPFVTAIAPASFDALAGDTDHTLPFEVTWTGTAKCADEDQVFKGSLDVIADGAVVATKPVSITVPACRWHHSVEMVCGSQDDAERRDACQTVVDGRYATAVTIYNPTTCVVTLVKYFAPLVLHGKPVGREPRTVKARPFEKLQLKPGEATLEDCCTLQEAVGPLGGQLLLGVLDVVADHALEVTVTHTANASAEAAPSINARTINPRRA